MSFSDLVSRIEKNDNDIRSILDGPNGLAYMDQTDGDGYTPLMVACKHSNHAAARMIIERNPRSILFIAGDRCTPLILACEQASETTAKIIIEGLEVYSTSPPDQRVCLQNINSKRTTDGCTALMVTCKDNIQKAKNLRWGTKHYTIYTYLKSLMPDLNVDIKDNEDNTALLHLCGVTTTDTDTRSKLFNVAKDLINNQQAGINMHNILGETPLMFASKIGYTSITNLLLQNGASLNTARKYDGATALLFAIVKNNTEIVKQLITSGADVNIGTRQFGYTPLMAACNQDTQNYDIIKKLVENGASVNAVKRDDGYTALILACKRKHDRLGAPTKIVNLLLENKADVNIATTHYNITALMWASYNGHEEVVNSLLKKNADFNKVTTNGLTAFKLASIGKHPRIIYRLTEYVKVLHGEKKQKILNTRRVRRDKNKETRYERKGLLELLKVLGHQR
jgi:ankyrin repeat protein